MISVPWLTNWKKREEKDRKNGGKTTTMTRQRNFRPLLKRSCQTIDLET
jgi:endogenous inhibitor of DNA gyrase (YacG/DUF329 family)